MQETWARIIHALEQLWQLMLQLLQFLYRWSFGEIVTMFQTILPNFGALPLWKQILVLVVAAAVAYLLYLMFRDIVSAVVRIFDAVLSLVRAIVANLQYVLVAGIIAIGGSWVINNMTVSWLP